MTFYLKTEKELIAKYGSLENAHPPINANLQKYLGQRVEVTPYISPYDPNSQLKDAYYLPDGYDVWILPEWCHQQPDCKNFFENL